MDYFDSSKESWFLLSLENETSIKLIWDKEI